MSFQAIIDQLPDCPGSGTLPIINMIGGFTYFEHGLPEFVGPDLSVSEKANQPDRPPIIIISAAGAVGKSTLAQELAFRKKAPIWDLAQASAVGGNSVDGQLIASFGFEIATNVNRLAPLENLWVIFDS
jgi:hypothetical protein